MHGATICATKPPPSRCVIGINFPGPWTRVRLPDDGLLAAPEGRLYWHLHRRCTMHALRGVRWAVGNEPRAACSTRAEPQSKLIDELCRGSSSSGPMPPSTRRSLRWPPIEHQQRRHRTPAGEASDGHGKEGLRLTAARSTTDQAEAVCSRMRGKCCFTKFKCSECSRDGKDFYVCADGVGVCLKSTSASAITCVQPGAPFT